MALDKKKNDFQDKSKVAIITDVDPQAKTVNIKYTSQAGNYDNLKLTYSIVGTTWGHMYMPLKGDRVIIDNTQGERPVIKSMLPSNVDYLPYLDPGEMTQINSNGSYWHLKNKRKKIKSTGALIDYDADKGSNGETDIELEPGGFIARVRSKVEQDNPMPRWYNHSYLAMYDNGDVSIQSMVNDKTKGLLHLDGSSGLVWLHAGDGKAQEYIELNPLKQEIVLFSDKDLHTHVQNDVKTTIYQDQIQNIGGALQIKLGVDTSTIDPNFDNILLDSDLANGDIRIDSSATTGSGKLYIHTLSDMNVQSDNGTFSMFLVQGDVDITTDQGNVTVDAQGNVTITSNGNIDIQSNGNITVNAAGTLNLFGSSVNIG